MKIIPKKWPIVPPILATFFYKAGFIGFRLHMICNEKSELLNFMFTPGDVDDRKPLEYGTFVKDIYGRLVGDKGYISKKLFERLFVDGIQLVTKLRNNMKGVMMSVSDKLLLRKVLLSKPSMTNSKTSHKSSIPDTVVLRILSSTC